MSYEVVHWRPWWVLIQGKFPSPDYMIVMQVSDDFPNAEAFTRDQCERLNLAPAHLPG